MKTINVEVCVCTNCVMNGAMDLIESIEGLAKLEKQLKADKVIKISTNKKIGGNDHSSCSPVVTVDDCLLLDTDTETVMEKILASFPKE